jgi:hypothetical protein
MDVDVLENRLWKEPAAGSVGTELLADLCCAGGALHAVKDVHAWRVLDGTQKLIWPIEVEARPANYDPLS